MNEVVMMDWLTQLQTKQQQAFLRRGFPTKKEERWKYVDFSGLTSENRAASANRAATVRERAGLVTLPDGRGSDWHDIVFINGIFSAQYAKLPEGVVVCTIEQAIKQHEELIRPYLSQEYNAKQFPFAALNTATMTNGMFLYVPKNGALSAPIHCLFINTDSSDFTIHPRNILIADKNSQVVIIEEHVSQHAEKYFSNTVTQIFLNENAQAHYYKIQDESAQATHVANIIVELKQDSTLKSFTLDSGAALARTDFHVFLRERGAASYLNGLYHLHNLGQLVDNHIDVNHLAEHGTSSMLYKGVLDKKTRAVFNGKVYVEKAAQKINAHQANHNLLLTTEAEINTKPELEIYADDVKCAHGATIGQLDSEALFYLRARGIDEEAAKKILTRAFAEEIISKIEHADIQQYIHERVERHEKY